MKEIKQTARLERLRRKLAVLARLSRRHKSDVDGSYTGTPRDGGKPVQDADDL